MPGMPNVKGFVAYENIIMFATSGDPEVFC